MWLAGQPEMSVPPRSPRAIRLAFRALAEEIQDNHKAMNLLARLRRAVRKAIQSRSEE
ncbi:MAG TPA: hypothetical protein VMV72_02375 [Verrucomicrobiae bacterium]|nr:hypothetical protein [Verrucomicrobiae bacterium]